MCCTSSAEPDTPGPLLALLSEHATGRETGRPGVQAKSSADRGTSAAAVGQREAVDRRHLRVPQADLCVYVEPACSLGAIAQDNEKHSDRHRSLSLRSA
jgi:hypothetical protein